MNQHVAHRRSDEIHELRAEIERLRAEFKRFMDICGEGSSRGRPMDLIPRADWERASRALERKDKIG